MRSNYMAYNCQNLQSNSRELLQENASPKQQPQGKETTATPKSCALENALQIKLLKHKKYLEILQDFLNQTYEYSPCCFLTIDDITNDYNEFIKNNDKIKNFNGLFGLVLKDIPLLDNRYCKKDIEFCNNCNNKYFKNCCEEYKTKKEGRQGSCYRKRCIINMKRKDEDLQANS